MPIQQKHIESLKQLYTEHFDCELADKDAWAMAHRLLNLYRLLIKDELDRDERDQPS